MPAAPVMPAWIQAALKGNAAFGQPAPAAGGAQPPATGTSGGLKASVGGPAPGGLPGYGPHLMGGPSIAIPLPPGAPAPGQGNTGPTGTIFPPSSTAGGAAGEGQQLGQQTAAGQLPGYSGDLSSIGANISAETAGQLPQDVITQIQQAGAERGVATGAPGSDNSNAAMLRALGLTSLDMTQRGQQNFQSILPSLPGYSLSQNPSFYTTPGENLSAGKAGADLQWQKQQFSAEQQAQADALRQAQEGVKAGLGFGGGGGGGVTLPGAARPGTDALGFPIDNTPFNPFGPGNPAAVGNPYATGITPAGGNEYGGGALNTAAMTQSEVDKILQSYTGGGDSAAQIDPETGFYMGGGSADQFDPGTGFYMGADLGGG